MNQLIKSPNNGISLLLLGAGAAVALWAIPGTARGQIYETSIGNSNIGEYNATTGAAINASLVSGLVGSPEGIALSGGSLFVVIPMPNSSSGTIGEYNATTGATVNASLVSGRGLNNPFGIAASGGNLFVANNNQSGPGTISVYNATTGATVNASLVSGLSGPVGVAISGGDLFVTNLGNGTIGKYNATTGATINASLVSGLSGPFGIAISGGNLFVVNNGNGTIGEYNATTGATVNASLVSGLSGPRGIAVSGSHLFVANTNFGGNGTIGEYNAITGAPINASFISGLNEPAYIAVPPPPVVTTNPATTVASFSATLNGSLNPNGSTTTVDFQYGPTTNYGHTTPAQTQTGNTVRAVTANISGLTASTTYHFRIVAHNVGGTSLGADRTFTTLSVTGPPVSITGPATLVGSFSATLNGSVDPHGLTTSVHFQYGTTASYGLTTAPQSGTGNTYLNVSGNISGLLTSHVYHYRIVATNSAGTTFGADRTFTTLSWPGAPVVTTNPATNVTSSSATLNGSLDPHGLTTTVYFQYGTTTNYGSATSMQTQTGNRYLNIAANISGLSASHVYHFRIVATNSAGTRVGSDSTFTTP